MTCAALHVLGAKKNISAENLHLLCEYKPQK